MRSSPERTTVPVHLLRSGWDRDLDLQSPPGSFRSKRYSFLRNPSLYVLPRLAQHSKTRPRSPSIRMTTLPPVELRNWVSHSPPSDSRIMHRSHRYPSSCQQGLLPFLQQPPMETQFSLRRLITPSSLLMHGSNRRQPCILQFHFAPQLLSRIFLVLHHLIPR